MPSKNHVEKDDFLNLVNYNYGQDLTAFFNHYLLTTDVLEIKIDSLSVNTYEVSIPNISFNLPVEVEYHNSPGKLPVPDEGKPLRLSLACPRSHQFQHS